MLNIIVLTRAQLITALIKHTDLGNAAIRDAVMSIFDNNLHINTVANYRYNLSQNRQAEAEEA